MISLFMYFYHLQLMNKFQVIKLTLMHVNYYVEKQNQISKIIRPSVGYSMWIMFFLELEKTKITEWTSIMFAIKTLCIDYTLSKWCC